MRPRPRHRRLVLAIVATTGLTVGGAAIVQFHAESTWQAMQNVAAELHDDWQARPRQRSVAWGDAARGDAFAHYARAAALAQARSGADYPQMVQMLRESDEQLATQRADLRARWQPVLDALRAGAHADEVTPRLTARGAETTGPMPLLDCRWVANAAVFAARAARHEGRHTDAVQHTLDAATFGADLMRRGLLIDQMFGGALLAIATGEAWPDAVLAGLDRPALDLLANGLERIDRGLPDALDVTGELVWLAHTLGSVGESTWTPAPTWRYGFSSRWLLADAYTRYANAMREVEQADGLSWPQREALLELELGALQATGNPLLTTLVPNLASAEQGYRQALAVLRLLRMAVDRHRGLDLPPLRDPLGEGPLRVVRDERGVELSSEGRERNGLLTRRVAR